MSLHRCASELVVPACERTKSSSGAHQTLRNLNLSQRICQDSYC